MSKNLNMNRALAAKNDEFYTRLVDIESELKNYRSQLKSKVILLPCDDPDLIPELNGNTIEERSSKFWVFFHKNFAFLGLKKIIATHYSSEAPSYMIEYSGGSDNDISVFDRKILAGNGDFRSEEVKQLYKEADIIVTNPPFSLFREFVAQLIEMDKKFLIIGNKNAITYKETFKLIKENKLWIGYTNVKEFISSKDGVLGTQKFGNIGWFTNLDVKKRHEDIETIAVYKGNESKYPKYENYNAISVDKLKDIPMDYYEEMGVPTSFLDKFNPKQFELVHMAAGGTNSPENFTFPGAWLNGKCKFGRIIIKRKVGK